MAMYSTRTADEILDSMKDSVRDDVDKREGAVVHDMLAPPAMEFEMIGFELDAILELGFADTSQAEYLERRTAELGVFRKAATKAEGELIFTGDEGAEIPIGTRALTGSGVFFVATTYGVIAEGTATVKAEAIIAGAQGNVSPEQIIAIENAPNGIKSVTNLANFEGGVDTESDSDLKARYLLKVRKPITSGNTYHYEKWATDVEGVSRARVYPIWNGNGTVKVVVIDANGRAPSPAIVEDVIANIERERPIGATVTVVPVREIAINIAVTLTLEGALLPVDVQAEVEANINGYLAQAGNIIRYSQIANAIIDTQGVVDYEGLTINGSTSNVVIDGESTAIVGEVILNAGA
ncbi:baseplate J/gp47 family protein [Bacillus sp. JJ722]|uniref:baseplate J/gp47 family protein n=1 Tax=Bacillus sp. JJ722 TaxID=3122973 RepID=UPI003000CBF5